MPKPFNEWGATQTDRTVLPPNAFADPAGRNRAAVEATIDRVVQRVLGVLHAASARSPMPDGTFLGGDLIPEEPVPEEALWEAMEGMLAGGMNPAHPGFMGHMDPMPALASVMGDFAAAAVNNNMLSREMAPVFSELEERLTGATARRFGLGEGAGGVLASGGTLANLHALAVARNAAFPEAATAGVGSLDAQPVLFASAAAHTSIQKAAMLLGLGTEAVVPVATDAHARMDPDALAEAIASARRQGPFAIVATAGTTTTGTIDPLPALADVARAEGCWLHVDAAYGGALVFSDTHRARLRGIERADSVTFNPQKWCYVAKTCAMALFRDRAQMAEVFRIAAPYMREQAAVNLGEIGVQGTRHADALKLWLTFQHLGRRGLARLIDASYRLTAHFVERVEERPFLEMASRPETNLVCFRGVPEGASPEVADRWNADLQAHLLREADAFLSLPRYRDRTWLRAVLLNPFTETTHVDRLFAHIDAFAESARAFS